MSMPPKAEKKPVIRSHHGREVADDYEWLREKSDETIAYLEAENAYTKEATADLEDLTETIYGEIRSRIKETDMSVPSRSGNWWYFGRTEEGQSYGRSCRVPASGNSWVPPVVPDTPSADEQVILDINELADGHEFFSVGAMALSTSGNFLAYSVDTEGDERFDLFVKDLRTGELLDDRLVGIFYGATWLGEDYLFYQRVDEAWRPDSVWRHRIGTPQENDVRVFHEKDERFNTGVGITRSEKYIVIESASKITSEAWVLDTDNPEGDFRVLWERENGVEYSIDHAVIAGEDRFVVTHNATGVNSAVGECGVEDLPPLRELTELVAHDDAVRIEDIDCYRDQIVLAYRQGGIGRAAVMRLDPGYSSFEEITFDEELYTVSVPGSSEWDAPVLRVGYVSFTTPALVLDYDVATGQRTVLKQQEVEGDFDPDKYTARRIWATARDGEKIPVSIVEKKGTAHPAPTLLYGYGSYEASTDPGFSVSRLSLLDRGIVFAVAHVRGGGEMGRKWYDNGKTTSKKNTFTDFIDVADDVKAREISSRIVGEGGSAGGMLIGAVANMAPDRFAGLLAIVPFVDPLTSMLMPELPLTVTEWDEWGDPLHDSAVYDYMASYAPYDNVQATTYPDILAVTSLNDTRVLFVEPAKWIAKLRDTATGGEFLLKTEMTAGHGGVSGRYAAWRQTAFEFAWVVKKATGLTS